MLSLLRDTGKIITNILLPPRCLSCGVMVQHMHAVCGVCWQKITFITRPWCEKCGLPLAFEGAKECGCDNAPFVRARAAVVYDKGSKDILVRFKHSDQAHHVTLLGEWLHTAAAEMLNQTDCLVPVPLHWQRLLKRKYNQSVLLAKELRQKTGITLEIDVLQRVRATPPQQSLNQQQRAANVAGAFAVKNPQKIAGKHVALVDDVWTTGATLQECTAVLLAAGAKSVSWACVARVIRAEELD